MTDGIIISALTERRYNPEMNSAACFITTGGPYNATGLPVTMDSLAARVNRNVFRPSA